MIPSYAAKRDSVEPEAHIPTESAPTAEKTPAKKRGRRKLYTKRAKNGRRSRTKGAEAEREVVAVACEHGFRAAVRTAPMQVANSGDYPDVSNVGRLWLEVKRRGKGSMYALAVGATRERPGYVPTLAYREDHGPWLAVVPLEELLKLEAAALGITVSEPTCALDAVEQMEAK